MTPVTITLPANKVDKAAKKALAAFEAQFKRPDDYSRMRAKYSEFMTIRHKLWVNSCEGREESIKTEFFNYEDVKKEYISSLASDWEKKQSQLGFIRRALSASKSSYIKRNFCIKTLKSKVRRAFLDGYEDCITPAGNEFGFVYDRTDFLAAKRYHRINKLIGLKGDVTLSEADYRLIAGYME